MAKKAWRNRIVGHGEEPPENLLANPQNWRIHPGSQQAALKGVLNDVGLVQSVIVNRRTGFLVDGHMRVMLALKEGQPTLPVVYVDLTEAEEAKILSTLDPIAGLAVTDKQQLAGLLESVRSDDEGLSKLLADLGGAATAVPASTATGDPYPEQADEGAAWEPTDHGEDDLGPEGDPDTPFNPSNVRYDDAPGPKKCPHCGADLTS
jgi:hypothetical protein